MALAALSHIIGHVERLLQASSENSPDQHLQVEEDLQALQRMVQRIGAVLTDAEKREIQEESVRLWLRELKVLAYDAEDVLDEFQYELLHSKVQAGIQADELAPHLPYDQQTKDKMKISDMVDKAHDKFKEIRFQKATKQPGNHTPEISKYAIASTSFDAAFWGKLASMISKINGSFEEIAKQRDALHLREGDGARQLQSIVARPPSSHMVDAPTIYGRKDDAEKVINRLLYSNECKKNNLSILPIVGMGGVGKTTLAQHVYNDQRTCGHFQMKGWVCVSDDFIVEKLTARIIESFTKEECHLKEFSVLQDKLKKLLDKKRFLLVLDDVWNEKLTLWKSLQKPLECGMQGSAVITTTRNESVANIMKTMPSHCLKCLNFDDCFAIFIKSAFVGRDPGDHLDLVKISKEIVKKCDGLPLAAKSLGGLLSCKNEVDEWEEVLHSDIWDLYDQHDEIIPALRLSYLHLPSYLRQCFLYASVFPKDFLFEKGELILQWMAHGFLPCKGNKRVEGVGNRCFNELVQRSLFQYHSESTNGEKQFFVMHDLFHDLAQHISGGEFIQMEKGKAYIPHSKEVRHVSIVNQDNIVDLDKMLHATAGAIRTLIMKRIRWKLSSDEMLPHLGMSLRVLDLESSSIDELPNSIGNLKHLRYLSLNDTRIERLPDSVCKLYNLQTLLLVNCRSLKRLPNDVKNLSNLQHLKVRRTHFDLLPSGFGKLTSLRALDEFRVADRNLLIFGEDFSETRQDFKCNGIELLKDLNCLSGTLVISNLIHVIDAEQANLAALWNKKDIRQLVIRWTSYLVIPVNSLEVQTQVLENLRPPCHLQVLELWNYEGLKLPSWMGDDQSVSLSKLIKLELIFCKFCKSLPPLGQLPSLKSLKIVGMYMVEAVGLEFYGHATMGFPKLEVLHFDYMKNWVKWELAVERGDLFFPCLRQLTVDGCTKLESMIPLYLLPVLEEVIIKGCKQLKSIELWSRGSPRGPPPLRRLIIYDCPCASFSLLNEDEEHFLLPSTLHVLRITKAPLMVEWCRRGRGHRLAHVPNAQVRITSYEVEVVTTHNNE